MKVLKTNTIYIKSKSSDAETLTGNLTIVPHLPHIPTRLKAKPHHIVFKTSFKTKPRDRRKHTLPSSTARIHCYSLVYALSEYNDHPLIAVKMTGHVAAQYITSTHFVNGGCNIE